MRREFVESFVNFPDSLPLVGEAPSKARRMKGIERSEMAQ